LPAERLTPLRPAGVIARYVVLGAALGLPAGLAWVLLAPRVTATPGGDLVEVYPEQFAAADLTLGLVLAVAGLVLGIVAARRLLRTRFDGGWAQVAGVIAGGLVCGGVARVVGWWLAGRASTPTGGVTELPLTLSADGVLLLAVLTGLLVVVVVSGFAGDPAVADAPDHVDASDDIRERGAHP
jgi:hypothetical protein